MKTWTLFYLAFFSLCLYESWTDGIKGDAKIGFTLIGFIVVFAIHLGLWQLGRYAAKRKTRHRANQSLAASSVAKSR